MNTRLNLKKWCIALVAMCFVVMIAEGQEWEKVFTIGKQSSSHSIIETPDSSIWVAGYQFIQNQSILIKLDHNGNEKLLIQGNTPSIEIKPCQDNSILGFGTKSDYSGYLYKISSNGTIIWQKDFPNIASNTYVRKRYAFELPNKNIMLVSFFYFTSNDTLFIENRLLNSNGDILSYKQSKTNYIQGEWIKILSGNSFYDIAGIGQRRLPGFNNFEGINNFRIRFDFEGNFIEKEDFLVQNKGYLLCFSTDKSFYTVSSTQDQEYKIRRIKNGKIVYENVFYNKKFTSREPYFINGFIDKDNNFVLLGVDYSSEPKLLGKALIVVLDSLGKLKSSEYYGSVNQNELFSIMQSNDDYYLACGRHNYLGYVGSIQVRKTKARQFHNLVTGTVINDNNKNCIRDTNEVSVKNNIVKISSNKGSLFYGYTDNKGRFDILINGDSLKAEVILNSPYQEQICSPIEIIFNDTTQNINQDLFLQKTLDCPYLTVDLGSRAFRPCFDAVLPVNFCNQGTATAQNAYIEVQLDANLTYQSSGIAGVSLGNNKYRFNLGNIPFDSCGSFNINTKVACDNSLLGKTLCNVAHIFPDSLCLPDQGKIKVNGTCNGATLQFDIKNESDKVMSADKNYIVIEDHVMFKQGTFKLNANEILPVLINAQPGKTYRLIAEQTNPIYGNIATAALENCNNAATPSTGFINQFPQGDDSPFEDIDCRVVTASYDPNDKQAIPQGVQNQHYIAKNTDIEYTIRFQNKGTDTAFLVVIKDTLSQFLDPATIQPGASSHPYRFDLSDKGIAKFVFANIKLPHQKVNDEGSNGFVKFRIKQKRDLAINTSIKNKAAIYFDYNDPIITNETFHTIGENWLMIIPTNEIIEENINVRIYPNPFSESTTIELNEIYNDLIFNVFDMNGRLLRSEKFNGNRLDFERKGLDGGMYIYEIVTENKALQKGKIVVF